MIMVIYTSIYGILPLFKTLAFSVSTFELKLSTLNLYRTLTTATVFLYFYSFNLKKDDVYELIRGFSVWASCLCVLILILHLSGFSINSFYESFGFHGTTRAMSFTGFGYWRTTLGNLCAVAIWGFLFTHMAPFSKKPRILVSIIGGLACIITLILVGAKTALLSLLAVSILKRRLAFLAVFIGIVAYFFLINNALSLVDKETTLGSYFHSIGIIEGKKVTVDSRLEKWMILLDEIDETIEYFVGTLDTGNGKETYMLHAYHNEYLMIFCMGGIIGVLAFLLMLALISQSLLKITPNYGIWGLGLLIIFLVHGISNSFISPIALFSYQANTFMAFYGILIGSYASEKP